MQHLDRYGKQYFLPQGVTMDFLRRDALSRAPIWCSVDLRDGNQALPVPPGLEEKVRFFDLLCRIGFKEIEVAFPAAFKSELDFCRALIERGLIPDDVTIQVLTQTRPQMIEKTFDAIRGAKHAIVHMYQPVSPAQREQIFHADKKDTIAAAVEAAKVMRDCLAAAEGEVTPEFSPESFSGTEPEFAAEIVNAVLDVWRPTSERRAIINLPVTVSYAMPHVYAAQVEYMCRHINGRENVIVSLHPHNDRGCAVADSELGLLAGADRVEGTLFGNGERTGNVDLVTLALNLFAQGVDPKLDFSNLPAAVEVYERTTGMHVPPRQPYSGALAFTAFSGAHQDAIAKGIAWRQEHKDAKWNVPYLPLDPADLGRNGENDVIRINAQSGKGGVEYILETYYHHTLPPAMRAEFGKTIKNISDESKKELLPADVYGIFTDAYVNLGTPIEIRKVRYREEADNRIEAEISLFYRGVPQNIRGNGNGRLNAVTNALKELTGIRFRLESYTEHALGGQSSSEAASYVGIKTNDRFFWGVGIDADIMQSSVLALVSAIDRLLNENEK